MMHYSKMAIQILEEAQTFFKDNPTKWTNESDAKYSIDRYKTPVNYNSRDASKWTPFGAIWKLGHPDGDYVTAYSWLKLQTVRAGFEGPHTWNIEPQRTVEDVVEMFQRAIDAAKDAQQLVA